MILRKHSTCGRVNCLQSGGRICKYFRLWIWHLWLSAQYLAVYTITRIIASWVLKEVLIRKQRLLLDINQTPCRGEWALEFYTFAARSLLELNLLQLFQFSEKWKNMYYIVFITMNWNRYYLLYGLSMKFSVRSGAPVAFKTWFGHQYRVKIICPLWLKLG